jgi:hypothetical protein
MTRRKFLITAAGLYVPAAFGMPPVLMRRMEHPTRRPATVAAGGGGDGPNTYYYSAAGSDAGAMTGQEFASGYFLGNNIVCTVAGSLTKLGLVVRNPSAGDVNVRVSLWDNGVTYEGCENLLITAHGEGSPSWRDVTLSTPFAVTNGQTVRIGYTCDTVAVQHYYLGASGGYFATRTYANGCLTSTPTWSSDYNFSGRVYVD